jgi:hypothetical protein
MAAAVVCLQQVICPSACNSSSSSMLRMPTREARNNSRPKSRTRSDSCGHDGGSRASSSSVWRSSWYLHTFTASTATAGAACPP